VINIVISSLIFEIKEEKDSNIRRKKKGKKKIKARIEVDQIEIFGTLSSSRK